ncbi:hypothetical protein [Aureimonas sp. ME7]|nr:hypothetical protein [Aureimonas sp. ME7]
MKTPPHQLPTDPADRPSSLQRIILGIAIAALAAGIVGSVLIALFYMGRG